MSCDSWDYGGIVGVLSVLLPDDFPNRGNSLRGFVGFGSGVYMCLCTTAGGCMT
jgi:hypothetical protein